MIDKFDPETTQRVFRVIVMLMAVASILEIFSGFVPTQYNTSTLAGITISASVVLVLNLLAIASSHTLKRLVVYRVADRGAKAKGKQAYPLEASDTILAVVSSVFFFGTLGGLLWWRFVWSQELGVDVQALTVVQTVLTLVVWGLHFYFTSGFRSRDYEKWQTLEFRQRGLLMEQKGLKKPSETDLKKDLQAQYDKDLAKIRSDIVSRGKDFDPTRNDYLVSQERLLRLHESARVWFSGLYRELNAVCADALGRDVQHGQATIDEIALALDDRLTKVLDGEDSPFLEALRDFNMVVVLPPVVAKDFDDLWEQTRASCVPVETSRDNRNGAVLDFAGARDRVRAAANATPNPNI
jgi:hypothetical protein